MNVLHRHACSATRTRSARGSGSFGMNDLTLLLNRINSGNMAAEELLPLVYQQLRQVAAEKMRGESPGHTLQATALVHDAWLRIGGESHGWQSRWQFFSAAAEAMRRILIERARSKRAIRHGGALVRVDLEGVEIAAPVEENKLLEVHESLDEFARHYPEKAELVKLRYFAGLTLEEAAEVIGISTPTAKRYWAFARVWLYREINRRKERSE